VIFCLFVYVFVFPHWKYNVTNSQFSFQIEHGGFFLIYNKFYLGGGFALSDATEASGLSDWIGQQLTGLQVLPPFVIMLIICIITATITEIASNTATANILLPILADTV
jgi:Na+/H+ antiporter NhaD/arsenite permease-like protein